MPTEPATSIGATSAGNTVTPASVSPTSQVTEHHETPKNSLEPTPKTLKPTVKETTVAVDAEQTTKTIMPDDFTTSSSGRYKLSMFIVLLSVSVFLISV